MVKVKQVDATLRAAAPALTRASARVRSTPPSVSRVFARLREEKPLAHKAKSLKARVATTTPSHTTITVTKVEPDVEIVATKVDKVARPLLCVGGGSREFHSTQEEQKTQTKLHNAVIHHLIDMGKIPADREYETIDVIGGTVEYRHAGVDHRFSLLALMEDDAGLKEKVEELGHFLRAKMPYNPTLTPSLAAGSKGNRHGRSPLSRHEAISEYEVTKKGWFSDETERRSTFPKTHSESMERALSLASEHLTTDDDKRTALSRIAVAERHHTAFKEVIEQQIQDLSKKLRDEKAKGKTADAAVIANIEADLNRLRSLEKRLQQVDPFAVSAALAAYPVASGDRHSEEVRNRAEKLFKKIENTFNGEHRSRFHKQHGARTWGEWFKSGFKKKEAVEDQQHRIEKKYRHDDEISGRDRYLREYAADVGGVLFAGSTLPHADYHEYCRDNLVSMKQDSFSDDFFRDVVAVVDDPTKTMTDSFSEYLDGFKDVAIKDAITTALDTASRESHDIVERGKTATLNAGSEVSDFMAHINPPAPAAPAAVPPSIPVAAPAAP